MIDLEGDRQKLLSKLQDLKPSDRENNLLIFDSEVLMHAFIYYLDSTYLDYCTALFSVQVFYDKNRNSSQQHVCLLY